MRVLIATNDIFATVSIQIALAEESWICETIDLGEDDFWFGTVDDYDIVLLDLTPHSVNSCEMLQRLRAARVHTPVLVLSASGEANKSARFLRGGADDFLSKPFDTRELTARMVAIVRRSKGHPASTIRTGKLAVNLDTRVVSVDNQPVRLTPKEYNVLELLSLRKGSVVRREVFFNYLYGEMEEPEYKILDVFISNLRKKVAQATGGSHYIETRWGEGYVLRDPGPTPAAASAASSEDHATNRENTVTRSDEQRAPGQAGRSRRQTAKPLGRIEPRPASQRNGVRDHPGGREHSAGSGSGTDPRQARPVEMRFEDAVTTDGGPLRLPQPDPLYSLFGCATVRCQE